jgi:hypothetical protein
VEAPRIDRVVFTGDNPFYSQPTPEPGATAATAAPDSEAVGGNARVGTWGTRAASWLQRGGQPAAAGTEEPRSGRGRSKPLQVLAGLREERDGLSRTVSHCTCLPHRFSQCLPHRVAHCLSLCLPHRASHCVSLTVSHCVSLDHRLSLCPPHRVSLCLPLCLPHGFSHRGLPLCPTVSKALTVSPSPCLSRCLPHRLTLP